MHLFQEERIGEQINKKPVSSIHLYFCFTYTGKQYRNNSYDSKVLPPVHGQ